MPTTTKRRQVQRVTDGYIMPGAMYTTEGCMKQFGFGRELLAEARQSGKVTVIYVGRRAMYDADELIAWLKSKKSN